MRSRESGPYPATEMAPRQYAKSVFVNCPFDEEYGPTMEAIVFAVFDCGFVARSALEIDDAGESRIEKIVRIIGESKFGIHDISRTELSESSLPRFNMPLELGLFLGARKFGEARQRRKVCLVLDREKYRYQEYISDIAGQDIRAHRGDPGTAIGVVRDWLKTASRSNVRIPGGRTIARRYEDFRARFPQLCNELPIEPGEVTFNDYTQFVVAWLREQPNP